MAARGTHRPAIEPRKNQFPAVASADGDTAGATARAPARRRRQTASAQRLLSEEIARRRRPGTPDSGEIYYRLWLAALENMVAGKGLTDGAAQALYREAWDRAADRTPHGTPNELRPRDYES